MSFTLRRGEVLGITGLLGAGRTELALTLFGMTRPERGTIALDGKVLHLASNRDAVRAGIAYVSEDRLSLGVILKQSIADNVILAVLKKPARRFGPHPARPAAGDGRRLGENGSPSRFRVSTARSRPCPAATSSASCWRNGSRRIRRC